MQAIGYARWSSLEQGRGSSLERQVGLIRSLCEARGWILIDQVVDEGTSAYTGANVQTGNLAALIRRIENGEVPRDVVLVVEQLDRISRLPPSQVVSWIQRVVGMGVSIATVNDGLVINAEMIDANPMNFMFLVFNAFRAYQESKHKSERLSSSWAIKRQKLEAGERRPITGNGPAWLRFNKETGNFEKIPERVALVQEIFDRTLAGEGKASIAATLNARLVETWGRGKSKADGWHPSYIQKILTNPAVIGEFQPHTKGRGEVRRTPAGEPIQGYFEPVVSEAQWAGVRAIKPLTRGGGNGFKGEVRNLFAGLCRCAHCGGTMTYQFKSDNGVRVRKGVERPKKRSSYLLCGRRARGLGCDNESHYRYEALEPGLLEGVLSYALKNSFFSSSEGVGSLSDDHYRLTRELDAQQARMGRMLTLYEDTGDSEVRERWVLAKTKLGTLRGQLDDAKTALDHARGAATPDQHAARVGAVRADLEHEDFETRRTARQRVMGSLREIIDYVTFDGAGRVIMVLTGGATAIRFNREGEILGDASTGIPGRISDPKGQAAAIAALYDLYG